MVVLIAGKSKEGYICTLLRAFRAHKAPVKIGLSTEGRRLKTENIEGILWILWTGAPWSELPRRYGSSTTVWRRLRDWTADGTLLQLWRTFLAELNEQDQIRWAECFADGTFASAKKGVQRLAKPRGERVRSSWFWSIATVLRSKFTWTRRPRRR